MLPQLSSVMLTRPAGATRLPSPVKGACGVARDGSCVTAPDRRASAAPHSHHHGQANHCLPAHPPAGPTRPLQHRGPAGPDPCHEHSSSSRPHRRSCMINCLDRLGSSCPEPRRRPACTASTRDRGLLWPSSAFACGSNGARRRDLRVLDCSVSWGAGPASCGRRRPRSRLAGSRRRPRGRPARGGAGRDSGHRHRRLGTALGDGRRRVRPPGPSRAAGRGAQMTSEIDSLLEAGRLKRVPVDRVAAIRAVGAALRHLDSAQALSSRPVYVPTSR